jgi:hypothetical protein
MPWPEGYILTDVYNAGNADRTQPPLRSKEELQSTKAYPIENEVARKVEPTKQNEEVWQGGQRCLPDLDQVSARKSNDGSKPNVQADKDRCTAEKFANKSRGQ